MTLRTAVLVATLYCFGVACGAHNGEPGTPDGGDAGLSADQTATLQAGGGSLVVNQEAARLADNLFNFDPTIDPTRTPAQNAGAIGSNVRSNLGKSCGKVSLSGATVTVSFGSPPGCTLANGDAVSGTVGVALTHSGSTTTVALTLTQVVYNGVPLSGTASFATSDGTTFTVKTNLTSSGKSDTADLTVTGASGFFSISGTASVTEGGATSAITFTGVTVAKGKCYASAGSIAIKQGSVNETVTFDASTPQTGEVSVQIGKLTTTSTLPPYGACPSG